MTDFTHGGHIRALAEAAGCAPDEILDFSANINPLGPPPWFRDVISAHTSGLVHYPDPDCKALIQAACERFGAGPGEVVCGNGSTEILYALVRALKPEKAVIPVPAYTDYKRACVLQGVPVDTLALSPENDFALDFDALAPFLSPGTLVFLGQPNNPTGCTFSPQALRDVARQHPESWFAVDEAFADFVPDLDRLSRDRPGNVIALYSLTKFFAMPGLRLGLGFAHPGLCEKIREKILPWSVNVLSQAVGARAILDREYLADAGKLVAGLRKDFFKGLGKISGLTVFPGRANFLLCRVEKAGPDRCVLDAESLAQSLLESRIAVRVCRDFEGLDKRYFRVAVRTREENALFLEKLSKVLGQPRKPGPLKRRAQVPALMIQGVGSNAGKSVIACALCRIFSKDGFSVAPFKSQNMSLNSFVTRDGLEMGRAQVTQAQAAGLEPDARMNPVLLKPSSDTGSQVIVMGRPVSNMDVSAYIKYKPRAFAAAKDAYDELCQGREVMVLEGAGSPAEINLKAHDIVNMRMAEYAGAKVLLAGDIDRGGVFAALTGTMELLQEWERAHVSGFVINRFRGDESLLHDALVQTTERTGKPFFGVVPYIRDLGLPEEDSVSFKAGASDARKTPDRVIEIAFVDLPHISNFTDMDALALEPDVHVKVARSPEDLKRPQAVILPGSKNVVADLAYLRSSGMEKRVMELAALGECEIIGVCGGFQMLGQEIGDPHGLESQGRTVRAMGLLPVVTELALEKTLGRVNARYLPEDAALTGYEIHHGLTRPEDSSVSPVVVREDGQVLGYGLKEGLVWGSYLHGLFDADLFRRVFVDRLRIRSGLFGLGGITAVYDLEPALDRLAGIVREHLAMEKIYNLLQLA